MSDWVWGTLGVLWSLAALAGAGLAVVRLVTWRPPARPTQHKGVD